MDVLQSLATCAVVFGAPISAVLALGFGRFVRAGNGPLDDDERMSALDARNARAGR